MFCSIYVICDLINLNKQEDVIKLFSSLEQAKLDCWPMVKSIFPTCDEAGYFHQTKEEFAQLIYEFTKPYLLEQFPWLENADKDSLADGWPVPVKECEKSRESRTFMQYLADGKHLSAIQFSA